MKNISVQLRYDSSPEEILKNSTFLVHEIYRDCLGREPQKEDTSRFKNQTNPDNNSFNDLYFDGKKIGSLATTFIVGDEPRGINLDFTPTN